MQLFIVTGASHGLGQALVQNLLSAGHYVVAISRSKVARQKNLLSLSHDLSNLGGLENKLVKVLKSIQGPFSAAHLINKAAVVEPIGDLASLKPQDIARHLDLNLKAPVLLSQIFIQNFKSKKYPFVITNISSGAATHAIDGWGLYCSSKAGLNMFSECLQLEAGKIKNLKVITFSPGVMDTGMQAVIRKQSKSKFSRVEEFKKLKKSHELRAPSAVAASLAGLLVNHQRIGKIHYDIRELGE